jgi:hypothetical protein
LYPVDRVEALQVSIRPTRCVSGLTNDYSA